MTTKTLTSVALARLAGCHRNTIVNYSKRGILNPVTLTDGTRVYDSSDIGRVREMASSRKRTPAAGGEIEE